MSCGSRARRREGSMDQKLWQSYCVADEKTQEFFLTILPDRSDLSCVIPKQGGCMGQNKSSVMTAGCKTQTCMWLSNKRLENSRRQCTRNYRRICFLNKCHKFPKFKIRRIIKHLRFSPDVDFCLVLHCSQDAYSCLALKPIVRQILILQSFLLNTGRKCRFWPTRMLTLSTLGIRSGPYQRTSVFNNSHHF